MKKMNFIILVSIGMLLFSCYKPKDTPPEDLIMAKWKLDSIVLYSNPQHTGRGFKAEGVSGTFDFRQDGKLYDSSRTQDFGQIEITKDTSTYAYHSEINSIITHDFNSGRVTNEANTSIIMELNNNKLRLAGRNHTDPTIPYGIGYWHK